MELYRWASLGMSIIWLLITLILAGIWSGVMRLEGNEEGVIPGSSYDTFAEVVLWLMFAQCFLQILTACLPKSFLRSAPPAPFIAFIPIILVGVVNTILLIILLSKIISLLSESLRFIN